MKNLFVLSVAENKKVQTGLLIISENQWHSPAVAFAVR